VLIVRKTLNFKPLHNERREGHITLEENGEPVLVRDGFVHQRMIPDEIQYSICIRKREEAIINIHVKKDYTTYQVEFEYH